MEFLGLAPGTIALLAGFGLLVGILFGCVGMGGSFLVTPALLVTGYPATVAVGSGLAFVFGTSVIGALRHRDYGQIDYTLAGVLFVGMTLGMVAGTRIVLQLHERGLAEDVVSVAYVGLLGAVGLFVYRNPGSRDGSAGRRPFVPAVRAAGLPPRVTVPGGTTISVWVILTAGAGIGILSGCLGVGGGFLLLPVMIYGFGVPPAVAAGTSILQIVGTGAVGTFLFAQADAVSVPTVGALLCGSAFGVRIGAASTRILRDVDLTESFAITLLAGSVATAANHASTAFGIEPLSRVSAGLLFGAVCFVSGTIVYAMILAHRAGTMSEPR